MTDSKVQAKYQSEIIPVGKKLVVMYRVTSVVTDRSRDQVKKWIAQRKKKLVKHGNAWYGPREIFANHWDERRSVVGETVFKAENKSLLDVADFDELVSAGSADVKVVHHDAEVKQAAAEFEQERKKLAASDYSIPLKVAKNHDLVIVDSSGESKKYVDAGYWVNNEGRLQFGVPIGHSSDKGRYDEFEIGDANAKGAADAFRLPYTVEVGPGKVSYTKKITGDLLTRDLLNYKPTKAISHAAPVIQQVEALARGAGAGAAGTRG